MNKKEITEEAIQFMLRNKKAILCSKNYISPRVSSEIADCSLPLTFDQYNYCSMGCVYCFSYFFKSNIKAYKDSVPLKSINTSAMLSAMEGKPRNKRDAYLCDNFYSRKFVLHWGGLADPFCFFENRNDVGLDLIKGLGELNYPTLFSFKGNTIFTDKFLKTFQSFSSQCNFAFQTSIITSDDKLAKQVEIGVPSPTKRIKATKILSDMGYWTILRLRPFIPGISDQGLDELLERSLEAGIRAVSLEFFALDCRSNQGMKKRYEWLAHLMGVKWNLIKYYKQVSPSERGGYMRGNRVMKEPHVRKIYEFCIKNKLLFSVSDPDYKELNGSGSCCGLPDKFEKNPLLENYSRNQLTQHLRDARVLFVTTGERAELRFQNVYKNESYFHTNEFVEGMYLFGKPQSVKEQYTYSKVLQEQWNNLNSPSNPANYLNGKVLPVGLDDFGNLIYKYNPMHYEFDWMEQGVDLAY